MKISPEGNIRWQARAWAVPLDLALDGKGFPYLAGAVKREGSGNDFWVAKFEPALGLRLWESYGPAAGLESWPVLAVDRAGNSWVCGASLGQGLPAEYAVVKHDGDGRFLWHQRIPGTGALSPGGQRLALDPEGGAVICGYARAEPESVETALEVFRFSPQGELLWKARRPGAGYFEHYLSPSLTPLVDASGNVFIAGSTFSWETFNDLEVVKYSVAPVPFIRGDCDGDGQVTGTVNDAVFLLLHLFAGGPAPRCPAACDAGGDGRELLTVTAAVYLIRFNFQGGPPPPLPFPACGHDTETKLSCEEYSTCDAAP